MENQVEQTVTAASNDISGTVPAIKKSRALPRVWTRFWNLKAGDTFFIAGDRVGTKAGLFSYHYRDGSFFFLPWRRVRTTVFVRDVLKGGKSEAPNNPTNASVAAEGEDYVPFTREPLNPYPEYIGDARKSPPPPVYGTDARDGTVRDCAFRANSETHGA